MALPLFTPRSRTGSGALTGGSRPSIIQGNISLKQYFENKGNVSTRSAAERNFALLLRGKSGYPREAGVAQVVRKPLNPL
jgi:hypothetical protein